MNASSSCELAAVPIASVALGGCEELVARNPKSVGAYYHFLAKEHREGKGYRASGAT